MAKTRLLVITQNHNDKPEFVFPPCLSGNEPSLYNIPRKNFCSRADLKQQTKQHNLNPDAVRVNRTVRFRRDAAGFWTEKVK